MKIKLEITKCTRRINLILSEIKMDGSSKHCPQWFDLFRVSEGKLPRVFLCSVCRYHFPKIEGGCPCFYYSAESLISFLEKVLREGGLEFQTRENKKEVKWTQQLE